jgi:hypothetical protein
LLTRAQAFELVNKNVQKKNVIYHMIAVEAVIRALAKHLVEDDEKWSLVGLLHDVD